MFALILFLEEILLSCHLYNTIIEELRKSYGVISYSSWSNWLMQM
ncbi:13020_t:CDS:1, partial [Funneliformis geosporum]